MELSRRQALGAAGTVAAASLIPAAVAAAATSDAPTLPKSPQSNGLQISRMEPKVSVKGGTVTEATVENFPVIAGNRGTAFWIELEPGGLREPHWHPNAWEFDVPVSGRGVLGVVNPEGTGSWNEQELGPGDIGFVPEGWAHYIENRSSEVMRWMIVFNNSAPSDMGLSTMFGGMPTHTFAKTFSVPSSTFAKVNKATETLVIVPH